MGQDPTDQIHAILNVVEGPEYVLGHQYMWLSFLAFKLLKDPLHAAEKEHHKIACGLAGNIETESAIDSDDISISGDTDTQEWKSPLLHNDSSDNLLQAQATTPALPLYGMTNSHGAGPFTDPEPSIRWGSEWEKGEGTP